MKCTCTIRPPPHASKYQCHPSPFQSCRHGVNIVIYFTVACRIPSSNHRVAKTSIDGNRIINASSFKILLTGMGFAFSSVNMTNASQFPGLRYANSRKLKSEKSNPQFNRIHEGFENRWIRRTVFPQLALDNPTGRSIIIVHSN